MCMRQRKTGAAFPVTTDEKRLAADQVKPFDTVILVVPIDKAAPKGRLILPQQQVIRDLLDIGAMPFVCRESELSETFAKLKEAPALVITDSQVFPLVDRLTPPQVRLTSFSILFARYKGDLKQAAEGAKALEMIQDGDSSEHFGGKSALYGTGAGCDGTGGTEGARCDGAAFADDGGDGVYAAGSGWLYHFASAERVLCNGCGAGGCKPGGNRARCAASGGTPGNPV